MADVAHERHPGPDRLPALFADQTDPEPESTGEVAGLVVCRGRRCSLTWDDGLIKGTSSIQARSICQMRSSHTIAAVSAVFDDVNLVGYGGLEPVVRLAERCGLPDLVSAHVRISGAANSGGANPTA